MARPRTCECELHTCKTCSNRAYRAAWMAKNPERAKKMAIAWADKRRARTNITEKGRRNAAERWKRVQDEKAAKVRVQTYAEKLQAFHDAMAAGAIELSEWIETDWRPNLQPGHAGRLAK